MTRQFETGSICCNVISPADTFRNEARARSQGHKKIFFKILWMLRRANVVVLPSAKRLWREDQGRPDSEWQRLPGGSLAQTKSLTELGPNYSRTSSGKKEIAKQLAADFAAWKKQAAWSAWVWLEMVGGSQGHHQGELDCQYLLLCLRKISVPFVLVSGTTCAW